MRNIKTFFLLSIKRNRASILAAIAIGITMCFLQTFVGGNINEDYDHMTVAIVDHDKSRLSETLISYLKDTIGIQIFEKGTDEEYREALLNRDISAIIKIPENYEESAIANGKLDRMEISTINNYANEAFLKAYLNGFLGCADLAAQSAAGDTGLFHTLLAQMKVSKDDITVISADKELAEKSASSEGFQLIMGFYLNFIFYIGLFVAIMILSDRLDGVFRRIQGTPTKPYQYMVGSTLYSLVIGMVSALIYIAFLYITHIHVGVPLWITAYLLIIIVVIVIGISLIFALLVKTRIGIVISIYGVGCIAALLGGAYFPTDYAPELMQRISMMTPQYWIMDIVRNMQTDSSYNPTGAMLIIFMYAILLGLIGLVLFNRQIENCE